MITDDSNGVFSFSRKFENQEIIIIFNLNNSENNIDIEFEKDFIFTDLLNIEILKTVNKKLSLSIHARWAAILVNDIDTKPLHN